VERATDVDVLRLARWARVAPLRGSSRPARRSVPSRAEPCATSAGGRVRGDGVRDEVRPHPPGAGATRPDAVQGLPGGRQHVVGTARRERPRADLDDTGPGSGGPVRGEVRDEAERGVGSIAGGVRSGIGRPWFGRRPRYTVYTVAPW